MSGSRRPQPDAAGVALRYRGGPRETRYALGVGVFGLAIGGIYWFLTYELAGTLMLLGFGAGALLLGLALLGGGPRAGMAADETPFEDEAGRVPDETLAPLAVGLGTALALTATVFGAWLLVAGALPLVLGAVAWLRGASDELAATAEGEARDELAPTVEDEARGDPSD